MPLTQYYTATTLDGYIADSDHSLEWLWTRTGPLSYASFIADVGALAMGPTPTSGSCGTSRANGPRRRPVVERDLLDEVIVYIAPVTLGAGMPLLPRHVELRLEELARNGDFAGARSAVVRSTRPG